MQFDYISCSSHNVIVDERNNNDHMDCNLIGELFKVKKRKLVKNQGLIAKNLVRKLIEDKNEKQYAKKLLASKNKKRLEMARHEEQIPDGSIILNLNLAELKKYE